MGLENYAPLIRTAYGALVNGYAVCEGYARAFKVVLDKMGVENQLVYGYLLSTEDEQNQGGAFRPHMWNYVKLSGKWYGIDSTINDTMNQEKYCFLQGEDDFSYEHIEEPIFSNSNYSFTYPLLAKYSYTGEQLPTQITYDEKDGEKTLNVELSYQNLSAEELVKNGLYLSVNYSTQTSTQEDIVWTGYASIASLNELYGDIFENKIQSTKFIDWGSCPYIKFAVVSKAPDEIAGKYSNLANSDIICESDIIINESFNEENIIAPFAYSWSPSNTAKMDITKSYHIVLTYDEQLVKTTDGEVEIEVISTHGATKEEYSLTNVVWNEQKNQLSFDFEPSKMYIHNGDGYNFKPINLIGEKSKKQPLAISYSFKYTSIICNKILDSGALYIDVVAHPKLLDNSDLSMKNWQLNGKQVGENQRSQLALVVTTPSEKDSQKMTNRIIKDNNLNQSDILSYSTYELDLDLCGCLTEVPKGSYMKVAFGFPQGYSAKDAGVTFKLYHFKRDTSGNIDTSKTEEISCVITEYGLVAEINDFSPFAVVALPSNKVPNFSKSVYSRVVGIGGSIKLQDSSNNIALVEENGKVVFEVVADEKYSVDYVLLNQKQIQITDGKIELLYDDLQENNILEVSFVAQRIQEYESANKINNLQKQFNETYTVQNSSQKNITKDIIIIVAILVAFGAICTIFVCLNKKQNKKNI